MKEVMPGALSGRSVGKMGGDVGILGVDVGNLEVHLGIIAVHVGIRVQSENPRGVTREKYL
ncbi:hypothetical protein [Paenisporosarcina sp. NPDC076898]|uniref:hypothetical protein n=1 Tax=unclassified Paenisporosarcina TaxID=2642018 RepID=UPI003D02CAF4